MQQVHFFTSITTNYLPKTRVLAASIKRFHPESQFHVVLSDAIPESVVIENEPFDSIITIEELPIPELKAWIFKHTVVEMCTGVKGIAFQEIIRKYNCEKVIYLDPDIVALSSLDSIIDKLDSYSILLTPHQTVPEKTEETIINNEILFLQRGVYNLGFLAVRNSPEGNRFLEWWASRCLDFCYDETTKGLFTDQKWVDLAPALFRDLAILHDPVYNVCTWNLTHRVATGTLEDGILINGEPICFYHFSGFDSGAQEFALRKYGSSMPVLFKLREWYIEECNKMEQEELGKIKCSYSCFDNGALITKEQRYLYRRRIDLQRAFPNPFATTNPDKSYFHWYAIHGEHGYKHILLEDMGYIRANIEQLENRIAAMETSKFWHMRKAWFQLKRLVGMGANE